MNNRLTNWFLDHPKNNLAIYFTAGYPTPHQNLNLIEQLTKSGTDIIEVGLPFSDPLADGPTIQESGSISIKNGFSIQSLFDELLPLREITQQPVIIMGYLNQIVQFGSESFFESCRNIGIDGLIIPDLPLHIFETEYKDLFTTYNLCCSFLITPRTPNDRIHTIDKLSSGFVYEVADSTITGNASGLSERQIEYFERIDSMKLENPRMIGFGISDRQSFQTACQYANGGIIGSAFIRYQKTGAPVPEFIHTIKGNES